MPTCRDIPPDKWEHARNALIYSFTHRYRYSLDEADDLAQDTLAAVLSRPDYEFASVDDFLRVVRAFAKKVVLANWRRAAKQTVGAADGEFPPAASRKPFGLTPVEMGILLDEVARRVKKELTERERQVLEQSDQEDRESAAKRLGLRDANHFGVILHRARKKIAKIVGSNKQGK